MISALAAGPASAADVFRLYGDGDQPLRPGVLAAEASFSRSLDALAVRADGVIAFAVQGGVYWIEHGRVQRVPVPASERFDLAFGQDGRLLVASCTASAVFDAAPDRAARMIGGRLGKTGSAGDGGPATAATLSCPEGVAADAAGGVLIADFAAARVRRIAPDGVISTVAGTGVEGESGDGGPATLARLRAPVDVAALPAGGFAIVDATPPEDDAPPRIRLVDPAGTIRTLARLEASDVTATADGALLVGQRVSDNGLVRRIAPDGGISTIADLRRDRPGIPRFIPVIGDPFGSDFAYMGALAATPDGGVLFDADFAINYLAPPAPALLGVAILPATRVPARSLSLAVRTTRAASVAVGVWKRGRRVASATDTVASGDATIPVPASIPAGEYEVHVRATGAGQIATARARMLVGGVLPVAYARDFVRSRLDLLETFEGAAHLRIRCQRMAPGRVDCAMFQRRRCAGIASLEVRPDGSLLLTAYDGGRRCRPRLDPGRTRVPR
jgi:hypothetical protein